MTDDIENFLTAGERAMEIMASNHPTDIARVTAARERARVRIGDQPRSAVVSLLRLSLGWSGYDISLEALGVAFDLLFEPENIQSLRDCLVVFDPEQAESLCRLLIDEGHMTPVAQMQLRKLWTDV